MRKLATIRVIKDIKPIEGADNIELILIDGWQCVSKKGEFAVGNLCVYFEIDSFLPIKPEFEFLRKSSYRKIGEEEGFRLRTIKLRNTLSQGLALSLDILPKSDPIAINLDGLDIAKNPNKFNIGDDITELLAVKLFEAPIPACLTGKVRNFPSFLHKTNQERIQNIWDKIEDCDEKFEITMKMDGTSCTYYLYEDKFGVCSRNLEIIETEGNTFWEIAKRYDIEGILRKSIKDWGNLALQGEVVGEGIQKNPHKIKGQDFYLFDIWNIDKQEYLEPCKRGDFYWPHSSVIKHVPIIDDGTWLKFDSLDDLLEWASHEAFGEGLVFKSLESDLSFKVISNNYLLNEK